MKNEKGCPHTTEIEMQSYWCCYVKNSMVDKEDCKKCQYGKNINVR